MIAQKSGLSLDEVDDLNEMLTNHISVVPREQVLPSLQAAARIMKEIDPNDTLYIAVALEMDAIIWSDDSDFTQQTSVPVMTTSEMINRSM